MSGCPLRRPPAEYFEFNPATGLISAYTGTDVDVGVPREIGGVTVVGFEGQNAFASCQSFTNTETPTNQAEWVHLRTLVLPETIREIPDSLLMYCQQLESFICYAPVESTGKSTFVLCRALKNVAFMNGVRVIDSYAFDSTDSLESLYFGVHVQRIASNAFNFSGLTSSVVDAEEIETGTLIDGFACHMEGSALIFSLMDSDAIATLRTDGTLALDMLGMMLMHFVPANL